MNNDMMGIIFAGNRGSHFSELTQLRSVAALPFGGRYRLIDFILSNMVNSGMINVGVATQINYFSLMDHLGSGSPWDLNRKKSGLFILPPYIRGGETQISAGNIDLLYGVLTFLRRSRQKYVLLSEGNVVCNLTFYDALKKHIEKKADITVIYKDIEEGKEEKGITYELDENFRVKGVIDSSSAINSTHMGMNMYIVERLKLIELIEAAYARGNHDFLRDIILANINRLDIYGYEHKGYAAKIDSIKSYFEASMDMLDSKIRKELFEGERLIYTKVKDTVPTKYGNTGSATDSIIADGCDISGEIQNSVIFRGVHISKNSVIKNSIIMQNSVIEEGCNLENVIIDKECTIREGKTLVGQPNFPVIIPKRTLL